MRLLVLGGTQFLGRAVTTEALKRGHDVTCAARGRSGAAPADARFWIVDRDRPGAFDALPRETFNAAIDLSRHPGQVRWARRALSGRIDHWTYVSSTSVYSDLISTGQQARTAAILTPTPLGWDRSTPETYGAAKVACEREFGPDTFLCRPGLIVGPGDPTGRFSYWVARFARGGEVLVPAEPDDPVQFVDVRDLSTWLVIGAERRLAGQFDAVAPPITRRQFVAVATTTLCAWCRPVWVPEDFLEREGIRTGSGPNSLPYPMPDTPADSTRDVSASLAAGLHIRPLTETVRDTADWLERGGAPAEGITAARERALLAAWFAHADRP